MGWLLTSLNCIVWLLVVSVLCAVVWEIEKKNYEHGQWHD